MDIYRVYNAIRILGRCNLKDREYLEEQLHISQKSKGQTPHPDGIVAQCHQTGTVRQMGVSSITIGLYSSNLVQADRCASLALEDCRGEGDDRGGGNQTKGELYDPLG